MKPRLALTTAGLLAVVGCASLFGVDGYSDSTDELCELLERCYRVENCRGRLGPRLEAASAAERADWLSAISDQACLEQCSAARRCLNIAPVCSGQAAACDAPQECCGFLNGARSCADGKCCLAKGASCGLPTDCCNGDCKGGFCGGTKCSEPGEPCLNPFDCCTGICTDGTCAEGVCIELGGSCDTTEDCCEGKCNDGRCGYEACRSINEECSPKDGCCEPLLCVAIPSDPNVTLCQSGPACSPLDFPCKVNEDCCAVGDQPLVCDPTAKRCGKACLPKGEGCASAGECCSKVCEGGVCGCSDGACSKPGDCCGSGVCLGGVCEFDCYPAVCHDECVPGGPLSLTCPSTASPKIDGACVQAVCAEDGFCCCKGWDAACIKLALEKCTDTPPCN